MARGAEVIVLTTSGTADPVIPPAAPFRASAYASPGDALSGVAELRARAVPTVLVIGPGPFNLAAITLDAGRRFPDVPIILATSPGAPVNPAGRLMARAAGSPALVDAVAQALLAAAQQARVRTTLDRLNVRLRAAEPPDPVAYRRLTLSSLYLTAILEQARDGIIVTDPDATVAVWNRAASELFRPPGDVIGRPVDEAIGGPEGAAVRARLHELGPDRRTAAHEVTLTRDGTVRTVELSLTLVLDQEGQRVGLSLVARDVTKDRALQHELQERAQALEESSRLKDEFLAILSHELRTPLNAVLGWTQILSRTAADDGAVARATEMIARNAQLQRRLVEDLLDYARIAAGRLPMTKARTDIPDAVRNAVAALRPAIEERQLRLTESYAADLEADVDEERLRQVVTNLVSNSLKFTEPGGALHVWVAPAGTSIEIGLADTGRGIPPEFLPFVFDEFRLAESSTTRTGAGLGLGLAIARRIVRLHGGDISASSDGVGRGATFVVTLPRQAAEHPHAHDARGRQAECL